MLNVKELSYLLNLTLKPGRVLLASEIKTTVKIAAAVPAKMQFFSIWRYLEMSVREFRHSCQLVASQYAPFSQSPDKHFGRYSPLLADDHFLYCLFTSPCDLGIAKVFCS